VTVLTRMVATGLAAVAMLALAWASTVPVTVYGSPDAVLRVAWGARPERIEECREQSAEALERLPAHMRQALVCEGVAAGYRLRVIYEDRLLAEQVVRGGGLRQDRRLYVFREFPLPPGEGRVSVRFDRLETPGVVPRSDGQPGEAPASTAHAGVSSAERARTAVPGSGGEAVPASLSLDRSLTLAPREVVLITYDPNQRELVLVRRPQHPDEAPP
jgi:hypothetical protein